MSNSLRLTYISNTVYPVYDFLIHLNHFSHPEEGGSTFLQSVITCTTTRVKNPKERPSCDHSGHENTKTQHAYSLMVLTCKGCNEVQGVLCQSQELKWSPLLYTFLVTSVYAWWRFSCTSHIRCSQLPAPEA